MLQIYFFRNMYANDQFGVSTCCTIITPYNYKETLLIIAISHLSYMICIKNLHKTMLSYSRSVVSTEGNFVRLNMKVKKYKRKGFRAMTGGAYKRQEWKKRMQGRQEGNSGNKCFKCGQAGHWAKNCKSKFTNG